MNWMVFNILLSLALIVVTTWMAYSGACVTLHPPAEAAKAGIKRKFILFGMIAAILIVVQGIGAGLSQKELQSTTASHSSTVEVTGRQKSLKQRAGALGDELFNDWNSLETTTHTQDDLDSSTPSLTPAQRAMNHQRIQEIERQFAAVLWKTKEADLSSLIEEIKAQGETVTGISPDDIEHAGNACGLPAPQYLLVAMKDCANRLQTIAASMH